MSRPLSPGTVKSRTGSKNVQGHFAAGARNIILLLVLASVGRGPTASAVPPLSANSAAEPAPLPAAHWPLRSDWNDLVGGKSLQVRGQVSLAGEPRAAAVRGAGNWLEASAQDIPRFGTQPFSLALWMRVPDDRADVSGDLLSQYDVATRRGFHLTLKSNFGVTSNQANWRHLQFGIDDRRESGWRDVGRPGNENSLFAFSLAAYDGSLYAGTCEPGDRQAGRVYRYQAPDRWADCGAPDDSNSVTAMAEFRGALYVGTGKYRLAGSALPESPNLQRGGRIFRYGGERRWECVGTLPDVEAIGGLVVFRGQLYASSLYRPAGLFRWDHDGTWTACPTPDGHRVEALTVHEGFLYAGSYDWSNVWRFDGEHWTDLGPLADNTQTYSFTTWEGQLLAGTWPSGRVYRIAGPQSVEDWGRLGDEREVMGMLVHNGRLLAGTLPGAHVYAYDGAGAWQRLAILDATPNVMYRRAWTMAEAAGQVFCSTLPSGQVFAFSAGKQVSWERSLNAAWHHVVAVRDADRLELYCDGELVATSMIDDAVPYDLSSTAPLRLGMGFNGPLNGSLTDVRIYAERLSAAQVHQIYQESAPAGVSAD